MKIIKELKGGALKITLTSLIAALSCTGIIYAATTVGNNISTGGTLDVTGAATFTTASSTGIVKFSQINSDTGAISFNDENLTTTGTLTVSGLTTLGNASTTLLSVSSNLDFATASSTGIVKFSQINSDTGSINFGDDNIYTTGNIGIGTSSPYAKLSVVGEAVASYFTATSTTATSTFTNIAITGGSISGLYSLGALGSDTEIMYNNSGLMDGISEFVYTLDIVANGTDGGDRSVMLLSAPIRFTAETNEGGYGGLGILEVLGTHPDNIDDANTFSNTAYVGLIDSASSGSWTTSSNLYAEYKFDVDVSGGSPTYTAEVYNILSLNSFNSNSPDASATTFTLNDDYSGLNIAFTESGQNDATFVFTDLFGIKLWGAFTIGGTFNADRFAPIYIGDFNDLENSGTITDAVGMWIDPVVYGTNNYGIVLDGDGAGSDLVLGSSQDVKLSHNGDMLRIWMQDSSGTPVNPATTTGYFVFNKSLADDDDGACDTGTDCFTLPIPTSSMTVTITTENGTMARFFVDENGVVKSPTSYEMKRLSVFSYALLTSAMTGGTLTIVPACGANCFIEFVSASLYLDYTSGDVLTETGADDDLRLIYNDAGSTAVTADLNVTGFIDQSNDEARLLIAGRDSAAGFDSDVDIYALMNKSLRIKNVGDEWGCAGTCTNQRLVVETVYKERVIDNGTFFIGGDGCDGSSGLICVYDGGTNAVVHNDSGSTVIIKVEASAD